MFTGEGVLDPATQPLHRDSTDLDTKIVLVPSDAPQVGTNPPVMAAPALLHTLERLICGQGVFP